LSTSRSTPDLAARVAKQSLIRLAGIVGTLLAVSFVVFAAMQLLPGDAARAAAGNDATPAQIESIRQELGLDRPFLERYADWLGDAVTGDLGASLREGAGRTQALSTSGQALEEQLGTPVVDLLGDRLANSLLLLAITLLIGVPLSMALGVWSALRRDTRRDAVAQTVMLGFYSVPEFVTGTALIVLLCFAVPVLPAISVTPTPETLVLPVLTLLLYKTAYTARLVRAGVREAMDMDHVAFARLSGLPERQVIRRHVLPVALGPAIEMYAQSIGVLAGGAVIVETLFGYPGIGLGLTQAVAGRDVPVVEAYVLVIAGSYVIANVIADLLRAGLDPRLRSA
jgi:peptide/nickel transport system permease protein